MASARAIEDFLAEIDESCWPPLLQELIQVESELRRRAGDDTRAEEYCRRFPEFAAAIESLFRLEPAPYNTVDHSSKSASSEATAGASPPAAGRLFAELTAHPDYEIVRELGRGGMGVVYLAHNRLMRRDEVLKVIGQEIVDKPGMLDRFLREIRAVGRLRHPNIVSAYTAFRCGGSLVFSMEYVDGLDLRRVLRSAGPLPVGHACKFAHLSGARAPARAPAGDGPPRHQAE